MAVVAVAVESPLPHLDRTFDYGVTAEQAESAQVGVRVRVRLAGTQYDGFVLERRDGPVDPGLSGLERVLSPVVVLPRELARLCRAVADHYAGSLSDVLRLAVPRRHSGVPAELPSGPLDPSPAPLDWSSWGDAPVSGFLESLQAGNRPRAAWLATPGRPFAPALATLVAALSRAGLSAIVVLPDRRDVDRVLTSLAGESGVVTLGGELGPAERYRNHIAACSGQARIVIGTRSAVFAPLPAPDLLLIWDDTDENHVEQRAPYYRARDVLAIRSHLQSSAFVVGGYSCSAQAAQWLASGYLRPLQASAQRTRSDRPAVGSTHDVQHTVADSVTRIPRVAVETLNRALESGPVLVQVGRRGYVPLVACENCRALARCATCDSPLQMTPVLGCPTCGPVPLWACPSCGESRTRSVAVGAKRTAEDLGRLIPSTPVVVSTADHPVSQLPAGRRIVVATAGLEPDVPGGYAAAFLPDAGADLQRSGVRAREETVRRWFSLGGLLRPAAPLLLAAPTQEPSYSALLRWAPRWIAERELAEREELCLPPAYRTVTVEAQASEIEELLEQVGPLAPRVLGPIDVSEPGEQVTQTPEGLFPDHRDRHRTRVVLAVRPRQDELIALVREQVRLHAARRDSPMRVVVDALE